MILTACVPGGLNPSDGQDDQQGRLIDPLPGATATWTPFQPLSDAPGEAERPATQPPTETSPATASSEQPPVEDKPQEAPAGTLTIWVDPLLPDGLHAALNLPAELVAWQHPEADLLLQAGSEGQQISSWVYALVAPFPTRADGITLEGLRSSWSGSPSGPFAGVPLLVDESTARVLSRVWGEPAPGAVELYPTGDLLARAWEQRPAWGIVPFEQLDPRWKVLTVDGQSPLRKDFDPGGYPLSIPISLSGSGPAGRSAVDRLLTLYGPGSNAALVAGTNREAGLLSVIAMTGVTALVRATAYTMEQRGLLYPGRDVRDWLRAADLTHISNEVPFARNCPYPNPVQPDVRFCSDPAYIALLEDVGTDIVELTGDHFSDWGTQAMYDTLEMYRSRGWLYYGGGEDLQEARKAVTIEHNGNRLAFIGCNGKGGSFAQAGPGNPGAGACDMDWLVREVTRLRDEGFLPIVTFQHYEYYTYEAQQPQIRDFRAAAEAGAVIVSGSQAHQPQAFEFNSDALIHYGLGNLFFDQYEISFPTRQGFIDRHVFYKGEHIGSELLTILFIDYARPRPMTPDERDDLLRAVFSASGW
jgi:poly-gamma-glutamate synthesis protein (capsule biosynthesis protein)